MFGIFNKIARRLKRVPESARLQVGGAYLVGDGIYFEIRQRDKAGNDYVCKLTGPIRVDTDDEELGKHVIASLMIDTSSLPIPPTARKAHWKGLLKEAGFNEKRFVERAHLVMISGVTGRNVSFQPTKRDGKNFLGLRSQVTRSCQWSTEVMGAELKSAFLACS